jgi:hypothetical protein
MKKILAILILLIIVALVIFLLFFKGFGGFGKDSGEGKSSDRSITETTEAEEIETTTVLDRRPEGAEITVSGHDYIFNNEKISLDDLAAEISKLDKESLITINADDTAAKNTVDDLTDKLDELGYKNYNKFIS